MKYLFLFYGILFFLFFQTSVHASIDLTVSPIKYEIDAFTGTTITKTAKLYNHTENTYFISTGKSDFQSSGASGEPQFVRKSELVFPDQQLSSWIDINTDTFIIGPNSEKEIIFTIDIPANATPGGHYGAIFFKNTNNTISSGSNVGINVDYGVLLLVNVDGEIVTEGEVKDIIITHSGGGGNGWHSGVKDTCDFFDFTYSQYDGKCIDTIGGNDEEETEEQDYIDVDSGFDVGFEIPFQNTGNTHIKPIGSIKLINEEGEIIKGIGKKIITNDNGLIIDEEVVDYLPINDVGGNVLPLTIRNINSHWKGFPYKDYDELGNPIIKYWSPSDYYTKKNKSDNGYLMFWERVYEKVNNKTVTAQFDITYKNENDENIEFNSAKDFDITYVEEYIGLNYYIIFGGLFLFLFIGSGWFIIIGKRKKKCDYCNKKIKKQTMICPHCSEIQKKYRKELEKQLKRDKQKNKKV